jgi:hypothetical protein
MTRKDYILLAEAIAGTAPKGELNRNAAAIYRHGLVRGIADALAADNPRFDRERFLKAAGVQA